MHHTYYIRLQVGDGLNEWPNVFSKRLGVDCPCVPTCSCACSFFSWVTLHKVECPEKMKNMSFIRVNCKTNKGIPHLNCNLHTTTKVGSKPTVFRFIGANRLAKSILDVLSNYIEIGRRWRALSCSLGRRRRGTVAAL